MYDISDILSRLTVICLAVYFTIIHNFEWWAILVQIVGYFVLISTVMGIRNELM